MPYTNNKVVLLEFGNKIFNLHEGYMKFLRVLIRLDVDFREKVTNYF